MAEQNRRFFIASILPRCRSSAATLSFVDGDADYDLLLRRVTEMHDLRELFSRGQ
ncbi:MAG TPA: hypothetical protein VNM24_13745 [Burkholderiales bacterium]|nr:hypothetical protein [Burkholderiales bacterium]